MPVTNGIDSNIGVAFNYKFLLFSIVSCRAMKHWTLLIRPSFVFQLHDERGIELVSKKNDEWRNHRYRERLCISFESIVYGILTGWGTLSIQRTG